MLKAEEILKEKGISYRLIKLLKVGVSFEDVIKYAEDKIDREEICKTIIAKDKKDEKYAFFLMGDDKIDFSKIKRIIGKRVSIISYNDLIKSIGTEPGAVCPLLLNIPIFVDKKVLETKKINFGSGNPLYGLEISTNDLSRVMKFEVVDVSLREQK